MKLWKRDLPSLTLRALCAAIALMSTAAPALAANPAVKALRLYVFDCGTVEVTDISYFSPGVDQGKKKTLADSCYLVAHPKGTLMWDAGFPDSLAGNPEGTQVSPRFKRVSQNVFLRSHQARAMLWLRTQAKKTRHAAEKTYAPL
ncbi:hypothetical protein [Massilia cavernae]|uniref:Uncharacterized protein n=1 Tax=Massilia cavernae TaxID=2320864 RepID=A0A418XFH6_9BURK|nr:hypothetical protein [Massilia cavernae]RJG11208.1 hypothetical protein D3872_20840 [Massilia cavernae]